MLQHDWPGNVRELQSAIEFACIGCAGSVILAEDLPPELNASPTPDCAALNDEEDARDRLIVAIRAAKGSRTAAALLLGFSRATLYRRMHELHLDPNNLV
jgi:transcriptional regulator of acetoin/glycerol metabolism